MFPHYTWGYIIIKKGKEINQNVPSLYVRVYRVALRPLRLFPSSLTIREGISQVLWDLEIYLTFPHYTWGYITSSGCFSLFNVCSLTIREGISKCRRVWRFSFQFPHYTWGYIGKSNREHFTMCVPSLYVRVYRPLTVRQWWVHRSLTIREGISLFWNQKSAGARFPHYTWGYIGNLRPVAKNVEVPSLYVRVYRWKSEPCLWGRGSLTIREGISEPLNSFMPI